MKSFFGSKSLRSTFIWLSLCVLLLQQAARAEETVAVHRPTVALALGGGGTRGASHLGVLRVLLRENIPIDFIAGTSIGAVVGGLYSAGFSIDEIQNMLLTRPLLRSYYTVPVPFRIAIAPIMSLPRLFGIHPYEGLYNGNRFANYLDHLLPRDKRNIEDLKVPFHAVACDLLTGKACVLASGDFGKALQASCAIPELRRPVLIGEGLYVDGGVRANVPVEQARQFGADIVIAVNVDENLLPMEKKAFRKIGGVSYRSFNMLLAQADDPEAAKADVLIHPDVNKIGIISLKREDALRAIESGEKAAEAALPAIRKALAQHGAPSR